MVMALSYVCVYDMYGMGVTYCAWFGAYQVCIEDAALIESLLLSCEPLCMPCHRRFASPCSRPHSTSTTMEVHIGRLASRAWWLTPLAVCFAEEARMGLFCAGILAMVFVCPAALLTCYRTNGAYPGDKVSELFDIDLQQICMWPRGKVVTCSGAASGGPCQSPYNVADLLAVRLACSGQSPHTTSCPCPPAARP